MAENENQAFMLSEATRIRLARESDLPDDTTWGMIDFLNSEKIRKERALKLGLPPDARWTEIYQSVADK